jgi:hypothetical protein
VPISDRDESDVHLHATERKDDVGQPHGRARREVGGMRAYECSGGQSEAGLELGERIGAAEGVRILREARTRSQENASCSHRVAGWKRS